MIEMESPEAPTAAGPFEARYLAFLETITHLRPSLDRYCARMTGLVVDGEDVVQEALFQAYRKLDTFDDTRPLEPWLFRIAHNRCVDFLRRRGVREEAEDTRPCRIPSCRSTARARARPRSRTPLLTLPPRERACVLLKDVFDYSLEDISELVGSTVGGVKAALTAGGRNWRHCLSQQRARARGGRTSRGSYISTSIDSTTRTRTVCEN